MFAPVRVVAEPAMGREEQPRPARDSPRSMNLCFSSSPQNFMTHIHERFLTR